MPSRYRTLVVYSLLLATVAIVWLIKAIDATVEFPSWWVVLFGIAASLFVWQFGLKAPRIGLISMERVPQIGLLLVLDVPIAAAICATASFIWPLMNRE